MYECCWLLWLENDHSSIGLPSLRQVFWEARQRLLGGFSGLKDLEVGDCGGLAAFQDQDVVPW